MTEAFLILVMGNMYYFTGQIPRPISEAAYNQFQVQKTVDRLDKMYLNEEVKIVGGRIAILVNAAIEQRVVYRWEF